MNIRIAIWMLVVFTTFNSLFVSLTHAQTYPKLAPYPAIRWNDDIPEAKLNGQWYFIDSMNDLPIADIIAFSKQKYANRWQKRIDEDIVQVLSEMGHTPGDTVKLVVRDQDGHSVTFEKLPLTVENRQSITRGESAPRIRLSVNTPLDPKVLHAALDEMKSALNERWSYRYTISDTQFMDAIDALHLKVDAGISVNEFGIELQKIIAMGIDGHASVSGFELPGKSYLPFLIEPIGDRFVAFKEDRSGLLAVDFPYLTRIDGKTIEQWCVATAALVPKGSPQYLRRNCLRYLRDIGYWRNVLGLPEKDTLDIELSSSDGRSFALSLPVSKERPIYGEWPRQQSRLLDSNIGYLRLISMDESAVMEINNAMTEFRNTDGLVIDLRDNGGGLRDALIRLYSYLGSPDASPRIFTSAAYRLHPAHQDDHLADRFMYRADDPHWTSGQRQAIEQFVEQFRIKPKIPMEQFSDWHYMALSRINDPEIYWYQRPTVILMNAKCFSATDIFLAGLKGIPNVTLMGTASGGGSAFAQSVDLGETPFRLRIGSMISFQSDGNLFDGVGVQPDVLVEPTPEYFVGGHDNALQQAINLCHSKK